MSNSNCYGSFSEWKEEVFPKLAREDRVRGISRDTAKLAIQLANESVERIIAGGKPNKKLHPDAG